jgi:transposase
MEEEVPAGQATFLSLISLLCSVPGISMLGATIILAEIGRDMSRFPTAGHLLAWAGMCPGQHESAGKRKSSRLRKGAPWLKTILVQCAWAATRKKDSYYGAQFKRLRARRGSKKAVCAVAASMRWSPFVGQFGGVAKLGSVSPQAANLSFSPLRAMLAA